MKRILSILLITIMIISCFSGCASASSGRQVCLDFLSCISEKDYIGAYALLDDSIKLDADDENLESRGRISEKQFVAKYSNIFAALDIQSVVYENIDIDQGEIFTIANFTGT